MKGKITLAMTLLSCVGAQALPVGNPSDASLLVDGVFWEGTCYEFCEPGISWCDAFSFRLGFYGDYVFNRHLEVNNNESNHRLDDAELYTNAALLVANFWNRLDIFATLGATSFNFDANISTFATGLAVLAAGPRFILETESHFSWSIGGRATLWECGCTAIGLEAQYFYTRPDVKRITTEVAGIMTSIYPDDSINAKYEEWQIGLGISHRIHFLVPYAAIKWSRANVKFDNASPLPPIGTPPGVIGVLLYNLRDTSPIGYAVGVTLLDYDKASLTAEGRFGDEKAFHVNGQFRF